MQELERLGNVVYLSVSSQINLFTNFSDDIAQTKLVV